MRVRPSISRDNPAHGRNKLVDSVRISGSWVSNEKEEQIESFVRFMLDGPLVTGCFCAASVTSNLL